MWLSQNLTNQPTSDAVSTLIVKPQLKLIYNIRVFIISCIKGIFRLNASIGKVMIQKQI